MTAGRSSLTSGVTATSVTFILSAGVNAQDTHWNPPQVRQTGQRERDKSDRQVRERNKQVRQIGQRDRLLMILTVCMFPLCVCETGSSPLSSPSQGVCPTPGCRGVGHIKGAKYTGHHR